MSTSQMDRQVFENGLKRLATLMDKLIDVDKITLFYDELSWIPTEAWPEIIDGALNQWDTWPRNFKKAIKALWFQWMTERKAYEYERTDCRYCHGEGCLRVKERLSEANDMVAVSYSALVACGHCFNYQMIWGSNLNGVLRLTREEIWEKGWEVVPFREGGDE